MRNTVKILEVVSIETERGQESNGKAMVWAE